MNLQKTGMIRGYHDLATLTETMRHRKWLCGGVEEADLVHLQPRSVF